MSRARHDDIMSIAALAMLVSLRHAESSPEHGHAAACVVKAGGQVLVAQALARKGLVKVARERTTMHRTASLTPEGRALVEALRVLAVQPRKEQAS